MEHGFRDCPFVDEVWNLLNIKWDIVMGEKLLQDWLQGLFIMSSKVTCRQIACAIWFIWGERNKWVHDRSFASPKQIVHKISQYLQELNEIEKKLPVAPVGFER
ncbi:hypothetical protein ES319_D04G167000v1 [Gossypium barbadense]|uniref:Uncharacterized protein n=1 Tax=Gossypium barbadense TaxID=3634 RepID=A0A5J5RWK0_GOSBA|nr:hypothetical protein ES319_D04G167000v1 [Gossypium barbadense]